MPVYTVRGSVLFSNVILAPFSATMSPSWNDDDDLPAYVTADDLE